MSDPANLSVDVLGQITLMQGVVTQLPSEDSILSFVCRGLSDLPGVESVQSLNADGEGTPANASAERQVFPIQLGGTHFADLRFICSDADDFSPYIPYVDNLCGMLGLLFEERRQRARNEALRSELEQRVEERTKALRAREEDLRITLNSIGDAVIATDRSGCVVRMNKVAEALTGWAFDDACGQPLQQVFNIVSAQTRRTVENPADKVLSTGEIVGLANHTLLIGKDGKEYHISDSGAPIRNDAGEISGVVLVFRDITHEYFLQEELRQSQKMDALGQLAGGIAHDFNNMLGGIMGAAEILRDTLPNSDESHEFLNIILSSSRRAAELTSKLLSFARKHPMTSVPCRIEDVIQDTVSLLRQTTDRRIRITLDADCPNGVVMGDQTPLQNAFLNLGINAAQAMPGGGSLHIAVKRIAIPQDGYPQIHPEPAPGDYVSISFTDTGAGIAPEHLTHIFEPFFTTKQKHKGTGLGLSAVHGTVEQHGGRIQVSSIPEEGTTFRVLLPLLDDQILISEPNQSVSDDPYVAEGCILLIDDEEVVRKTVRVMLERLGYEVLLADNGQTGVACFEQNKEKINLVIVDMVMPEMNGSDCVHAIRQIVSDVPILIASGYSGRSDLEELIRSGCLFLGKPYAFVELARTLQEALNGKPSD